MINLFILVEKLKYNLILTVIVFMIFSLNDVRYNFVVLCIQMK